MAARVARVLPPPLAVALLLVATAAAPAAAQRLALGVTGPTSSTFTVVDLATSLATPATADEAQVGAVFTSDGMYAVRVVAAGQLIVRHMPSGQQTPLGSSFQPRVSHPRRHTIFGTYFGALARFDERGLVQWDACGVFTTTTSGFDLSLDGRSLYTACPNGDLVGLDTESGAEIRRLAAIGASGVALNPAATEAVVLRRVGGGLFDLVRLDLATGQTIATRQIYSIRGTAVTATPDHRRFLLTLSLPAGAEVLSVTTLLDAVTLEDVLGLASSWGLQRHSAVVSPDGRDAFVVATGPFGDASAVWIDIDSGTSRASASVGDGYALALGYAPAPLPVVLAPAQVAAGTVTLAWTLPAASPMVTGYRVEAGTASGLANLGTFPVAAAASFSAAGVPSGRYYVRVRAVNVNGVSAPSNEVIVDVP